MKYLCIDYGSRKIGIAISDDEGKIAFPYDIWENNGGFLEKICALCEHDLIEGIVIGESMNNQGEENKIMEDINRFKEKLELMLDMPIHMEREWMSSVSSRIAPVEKDDKDNVKESGQTDDKAAAIILQRFLDRNNNR